MLSLTQNLTITDTPEKQVAHSHFVLQGMVNDPNFESYWENSPDFQKSFIDEFETLAASFHTDGIHHGFDGLDLPFLNFIQDYYPATDALHITTTSLQRVQSCYREQIDSELINRLFPPIAHIRWMIRRDHPAVLDIRRSSFPIPWSEEELVQTLRQRNCIGMIAEAEEKVVGYMIYELHSSKVHLMNLAVDPEKRNLGVGKLLIDKLKGKLSPTRRTQLTVEDKEITDPAERFLTHQQLTRDPSTGLLTFNHP